MISEFEDLCSAIERLSDDAMNAGQAFAFINHANTLEGFHENLSKANLGRAYERIFNAMILETLAALMRSYDKQPNTGSIRDVLKKLDTEGGRKGCIANLRSFPMNVFPTDAAAICEFERLKNELECALSDNQDVLKRLTILRNKSIAHSQYKLLKNGAILYGDIPPLIKALEGAATASLLLIKGTSIRYSDFTRSAIEDATEFWAALMAAKRNRA